MQLGVFFHDWQGEQLLSRRTFVGISLHASLIQIDQVLGALRQRNLRDELLSNLLLHHVLASSLECLVLRDHLVEDATQGPDISFHVVWLFIQKLRATVGKATDCFVDETFIAADEAADAEICKFHVVLFRRYEQVLRLDVPVYNILAVQVRQSLADLDEELPDA